MFDQILSPGAIKPWTPDRTENTVASDIPLNLRDGSTAIQDFTQERLSEVVEREKSILSQVDLIDLSKAIPHTRNSFGISSASYESDILNTILGYISVYSSVVKVHNSIWPSLPVLLSYRLSSIVNLEKLVSLYNKRKAGNGGSSSGISSTTERIILELKSDMIMENIPYEIFSTLPIEVYDYTTDLYKALVVSIQALYKDKYAFAPPDTFVTTTEVVEDLLDIYTKIYIEYMYASNRDLKRILALEDTLTQLDELRNQLGFYVK
jgi:hypothetical protein